MHLNLSSHSKQCALCLKGDTRLRLYMCLLCRWLMPRAPDVKRAAVPCRMALTGLERAVQRLADVETSLAREDTTAAQAPTLAPTQQQQQQQPLTLQPYPSRTGPQIPQLVLPTSIPEEDGTISDSATPSTLSTGQAGGQQQGPGQTGIQRQTSMPGATSLSRSASQGVPGQTDTGAVATAGGGGGSGARLGLTSHKVWLDAEGTVVFHMNKVS